MLSTRIENPYPSGRWVLWVFGVLVAVLGLIALSAQKGAPCSEFAADGTVDLKQRMGEVLPAFYFQTSASTVVRDLVLIGCFAPWA